MTTEIMDVVPGMTKDQKDIVYTMRELGRDRFQARAAEYDRENKFPFENYDDLREAGFLGLTIPRQYGGMGADYQTYAMASAELGRWCEATALSYNMHAMTMMWTSQIIDDLDDVPAKERDLHEKRRAGIYDRVIKDGAIFAQPFSEPNSAAAAGKAAFGTTAHKVDGGWKINGMKHFASLSGAAHYFGLVCTDDAKGDEMSPKDTIYIAVPADADGVEIFGDWDVMGMRPTDSRSLKFEDVFVPDELTMMPRGAYYRAALQWPHMFMTLCPTYMGVAQAAFDYTVGYLRGEVEGAPPGGAARNSTAKQMAVAQMRIKLEQARALFARVIGEARANPTREERLRAYAAQHTVMEYANDICQLGLRTCGGRAIFKKFPMERLYRSSRCGSLMLPWTAEICEERLGKESLFDLEELRKS